MRWLAQRMRRIDVRRSDTCVNVASDSTSQIAAAEALIARTAIAYLMLSIQPKSETRPLVQLVLRMELRDWFRVMTAAWSWDESI